MRAGWLVVWIAIAGCTRDEPATTTTPLQPPPPSAPVAVAAPALPAMPAPVTAAHLEVRDHDRLCMHPVGGGPTRCHGFHWGIDGLELVADAPAPQTDEHFIDTDGKTPCVLHGGDTLTCGSRAAEHVELRWAQQIGYLLAATGHVRWFEPPVDPCGGPPPKPHPLHDLPFAVTQLSASYRTACAIATDGTTSCWSDPAHPAKLATPEPIAELMTQNTFELCARGVSGKVYCAPSPALPGALACSMESLTCGDSGVEDPVLHEPFDPVVWLRKPLAALPLPFAAVSLVRADGEQYGICMDTHLHMQPAWNGGCAIGAAGEVACFAPDELEPHATWHVYAVAKLPPAKSVFEDGDAAYALTADGALFGWTADAPTAKKLDLPPVAEFTDTLYIVNGPSTKAHVRCALTRDGDTRCWRTDRGADHAHDTLFDPLQLPPARN